MMGILIYRNLFIHNWDPHETVSLFRTIGIPLFKNIIVNERKLSFVFVIFRPYDNLDPIKKAREHTF
jgi:hypothetical protein